jgi:hypothetical protein
MGLESSDRETPTATFDELQAFRTKAIEMGLQSLATAALLPLRGHLADRGGAEASWGRANPSAASDREDGRPRSVDGVLRRS